MVVCEQVSLENVKYSITPKFTADTTWEGEENHTASTASPASLGKTVHGTLRSSSDEDWCRVSLPKAGKLSVSFSGEYLDVGAWRAAPAVGRRGRPPQGPVTGGCGRLSRRCVLCHKSITMIHK